MSTPDKSTKTTISITHGDGSRTLVPAILVSPRIAVHRRTQRDGTVVPRKWHVSDPVSGYAWLNDFRRETDAVRWAESLFKKFGPNPLKGAIVDPLTGGWKRKGVYHEKVKNFVRLFRTKAESF